jgi:ribulose-phosphate 3-epimerase
MKISASLYAADPLRLAEAVAAVGPYIDSLHVDVMDGRFAPAFGFGERLVQSLVGEGALPVDVHLMVERPEPWAVRFAALGARSVAFHLEAAGDPIRLAEAVRDAGALAHLALSPETSPSEIPGGPDAFDGVLLLTAPAGGGELDHAALARVGGVSPSRFSIVDGRIDGSLFGTLKAAGVALAVIGADLFVGDGGATRAQRLASLAERAGGAASPPVRDPEIRDKPRRGKQP